MMSSTQRLSGKRLTFTQLLDEYHIEIPIIQRDYAQGRPLVKDIRNNFINALYKYLEENKPNRDLDFIYGNQLKNEGFLKFVPLDGQQRLTTLFLLHWYLANRDNRFDDIKNILGYENNSNKTKSKFAYETRTSSREFCDALVNNNINLDNLYESDKDEENSLSKTIKDKQWFFLSWNSDPTIKSMLVMLDTLHENFKNTNGFFERLISTSNTIITFQFLDLEDFKLTDDLYIKMNDRGIPLTPFENFKANFEEYIKKSDFNKSKNYTLTFDNQSVKVNIKDYFSNKIDTNWANLFWEIKKGTDKKIKYDSIVMNFIKAMLINNYAGFNSSKSLKHILDRDSEEITFQEYEKLDCINEKLITNIISILDLLNNGNDIEKYIGNFYYDNKKEFRAIVLRENTTANYLNRIQFHAFNQYLIQWQEDGVFTDVSGLKSWMRVIYNLSENTTPYNNEKEFSRSIISIDNLMEHSNKIYDYFIDDGNVSGFDQKQIEEERIKSFLLQKGGWEQLIFEIEQHGYFKGQIGFILLLSGIKDYFETNKNCDWSDVEDVEFKKSFKHYSDIAKKIFNSKGLNKFDNFIWERALLACGNYLIKEGSSHSFLIDYDRDISWKRFLKGGKEDWHNKTIVSIFNKIDINNIEKSLIAIKDGYTGTDWKSKFIKHPELIDYLGDKRYVRKHSEQGFILISKKIMSSAHAELFSYSSYINSMKGNSYLPFSKVDYYFSNDNNEIFTPCIFLDKWEGKSIAVDIRFLKNSKNYEIRFFDRELEFIDDKIVTIISKLGFNKTEKYNDESFILQKDSEQEILVTINELCDALK